MSNLEIRKLDKKDLKDRVNIFQYESAGHYKVEIKPKENGWKIDLTKQTFEKPFKKFDDQDIIIQPFKGDSEVHGAFIDEKEAGLIQFEFQEFNKSVRVWDIDIWPEFQHQGAGTALMQKCISVSKEMGARRIVLEVQSSNLPAINFYKKMGFELIGLDVSNYNNDDIERNEVRLEMALYLD